MSLQLIRNDITKMHVDAIVNAANETLLGGGGVDGAIHRAAGPELLAECRTLHGCATGQAKITKGYNLPARYVIHTVGPIWNGGKFGEQKLLESCYRMSLELAVEHDCHSIAFPLISAGVYGYPKYDALQVATQTIKAFLETQELEVYLVLFDRQAVLEARAAYPGLAEYIDDNYAKDHYFVGGNYPKQRLKYFQDECAAESLSFGATFGMPSHKLQTASLQDELAKLDESFTQMLLRKIDETGMKESACYKKANVDRKLFHKIKSDVHYHPRKQTALAFAIALHLDLEETRNLLEKAGYALTKASKFDIIVQYFIERREYDIYKINEALFAYDQQLLG